MASVNPYLAHRDVIERAIVLVCRRHRLSHDESADFGSIVRLHLVDDDYSVLRQFEGRSSIQTYLLTVISRCFLDWRNSEWGKWRPSAEARRAGPLAIRLETLILRDGLSLDEAVESLRTNQRIPESREALETLWGRMPVRTRRRAVGEEALLDREATDASGFQALRSEDARRLADLASHAMEESLAALLEQDRLILRLRFDDGLRVVEIARLLALDQKQLYRRIDALLERLRVSLVTAGIRPEEISDILEHRGFDRDTSHVGGEFTNDVRPPYRESATSSKSKGLL